ncbi:MAG: hypothetical protein PHT13_11605 [Methanosarcina sp.]|nr:hypothetical protein [Methanosarcina sp.]
MAQTQKKPRTKKKPNAATKQPSSEPGLFELFMGLAEQLDEPYRTSGKKIVNVLFFATIAMLAVSLISSFMVALTDPQTGQLISNNKSILTIGACAIGAIMGFTKETYKK